jgi:hypothetical protein
MSQQFHFENLSVEIPDPHSFELSEEERMEKYPAIADGLAENKKDFEELTKFNFALMDYFDLLEDLISPDQYTKNVARFKDRIIETAKFFTDCIVALKLDLDKASNKDWRKDQALWHTEFEKAVKEVAKIKNQLKQGPALEDEPYLEDLFKKEHIFFNHFALMVACRQTILPDDREKIRVEKQ